MFTCCCWYVCNAVLDLTDPSHSSVNGLLELSLWADLFTLIGYWFVFHDLIIASSSGVREMFLSRILTVSAIFMQVSGSAVSRALTAGRQPCLRGRVTPLCCLLSLSRAQVCLYMDGAVSIYTHTSPSHTHTHTHGQRGAALSTIPFF